MVGLAPACIPGMQRGHAINAARSAYAPCSVPRKNAARTEALRYVGPRAGLGVSQTGQSAELYFFFGVCRRRNAEGMGAGFEAGISASGSVPEGASRKRPRLWAARNSDGIYIVMAYIVIAI